MRVRMVYRYFLDGKSCGEICKTMIAYEAKKGATRKWSDIAIRNMLRHEAYVGDLLTIFSAMAQEESRSISENVKVGIRGRYKMGKPP